MKKGLILVVLFVLFLGISNSNSTTSIQKETSEITCTDALINALIDLYDSNGDICGDEIYKFPKSYINHISHLEMGCYYSNEFKVENALSAIINTAENQLACYSCETIIGKLNNLIAAAETFECSCVD